MAIFNMVYYKVDSGWKPGANTVMWFPFEINQFDYVGGATINTTGTKQTLGYTFSSNGEMVVSNGSSSCRFVSVWVKYNSSNGSIAQGPSSGTMGQILYNFMHSNGSYNQRFQIEYTSGKSIASTQQSTTTGTRYHLAMGWDGSKVQCYINGNKVWEQTTTAKTGLSFRFGYGINQTVSQYIGESVCWTDAEVLNYFNQTKATYGVS